MGIVPYKILAEGVFGGRYAGKSFHELRENDRKVIASQQVRSAQGDLENAVSRVQSYCNLAKDLDITPAQLTYAFVLTIPQMSSLLMSTRKAERVEENLGALDITLNPEIIQKINELFPMDYYEYDTYYQVQQAPIPDVTGKIPEDRMRF